MMTCSQACLRMGIAVISLVLFGVNSAHATSITFQFQGTVSSIDPLVSSKIKAGDSIVGSYTFDSKTPCSFCDVNDSVYPGAVTDFSIRIGSYVGGFASSSDHNFIIVSPLSIENSYIVQAGFSGNIGDSKPAFFQLFLEDFTGTALGGSNSLSTTPADPATFKHYNTSLYLNFLSSTGQQYLGVVGNVASLTNVTRTNVPEPGTLTLLALAVGLLAPLALTRL